MKKRLFICLTLAVFGVASLWIGIQKIDWTPSPSTDCPYCNPTIFNRQLVFQGNSASVLITHKPAVPGHLLIIPNRHVEHFDALTSDEISEIGKLIKQVKQVYTKQLHTTEYLLIQKNGRLAGQSVPHVHVHILPRTKEIGPISFLIRFFVSPFLKPLDEAEIKLYRDIPVTAQTYLLNNVKGLGVQRF